MANIKFEEIDKALSSHGGLALVERLFQCSNLSRLVEGTLPALKSGTARSAQKLKNLIMGFGAGLHCLEDINEPGKDPGFVEVCDKTSYTLKDLWRLSS